MAGTRIACPGCGKPIEISHVRGGEGATVPWRVTLPPGHDALPELPEWAYFWCDKRGNRYMVRLPKREADDEPTEDSVEHETWLEYHDRLVKEYYDLNAEWALIKEICPELDRPEPAPEDPIFGPLNRGIRTVARGLFFSTLAIGLLAGLIWLLVRALVFIVGLVS